MSRNGTLNYGNDSVGPAPTTAVLFLESHQVVSLFNPRPLNSHRNHRKFAGLHFRDEEIEAKRV